MAFFRGRKNKKFVGLFILLIIVGVGGFFFFNNIKKASAEWFDQNWFYREAVNISNAGSNQTDYQVSITLNTQSLISAGKLQSNCSDIRVTDANGKLLPYWIETGTNACNTTTTAIWTKVPSIPTSGQTVYIYYGNPNAISAANGNNVFQFFDDFSGSSLDANKWTSGSSDGVNAVSLSSGLATIITTGGQSWSGIVAKTGYTPPVLLEARVTAVSGIAAGIAQAVGNTLSSNMYFFNYWNSGFANGSISGGLGNLAAPNIAVGIEGIVWIGSSSQKVAHNYSYTSESASSYSLPSFVYPTLGIGCCSGSTSITYDWARIRKYAATEPIIGSTGSEEKGPAPVAYWKFDEGQGLTAYDSSSNKNNGTLFGTTKPIWQTGDMCVSGKCLKFDGITSYVDAGNPTQIDITQQITTEIWVKFNSTPANKVIFTNWESWSMNQQGQQVNFWIDDSGATRHGINTGDMSLNVWHHVVGTYDGSTQKTFVDGVQQSQTASWSNTIESHPTAHFYMSYPGYEFSGFMDDVKIYPYARTAAQILADYNSRGASKGTSAQVGNQSSWMTNGLVGYWKMDDVSGDAIDSSGNGNTGTVNGAPASAAGVIGPAKDFVNTAGATATDYYNIASMTGENTDTLTVAAWIKPDVVTSTERQCFVQTPGSFFDIEPDGTLRAWFQTTPTGWVNLDTSGLQAGVWQHVVQTYDRKTRRVYINGIMKNSATNITDALINTGATRIGDASWSNEAFDGKIQQVRVYNRALSPKEVSDLYNWAPGPIGWWKMDDKIYGNSQTIIDSSGYGNNGTTNWGGNASGMNCKIIGKYGGGCLFDGIDDYVDMGNVPLWNLANKSHTLEAWFRIVSPTGGTGGTHWILGRMTGGSPGAGYVVYIYNGGQISYEERSTGTPIDTVGTPPITDNNWHYIAATIDINAKMGYVYLDGKLLISSSYTGDLIDQNNDLTVGGNPGGYGFNSDIDDVRIYDYARTQKQIAEDMNAGHPSVGSPVGSYAAWWKFDEGYGNSVHDMSVNANTGTNHGASWTNDGKFGKALSFNGTSSYVSVIGNANFTSPTGYTWSAWINQTSLTDYQAIMSHSDTTACEDFTFYTSANGTLTFGVDGTGCGQQGYGGLSSSAGAISVNKWYHIVGVADFSNTYKTYLYINGQLVTSRDATGINPVNRAMNFSIGRSYDGGGVNTWYFNGLIDEVKVYPFALTADDVKTEYNRGSALKMGSVSDTSGLSGGSIASNSASAAYCIPGDTASCNSPVGEWKFDDHTGTYANDTSGNNNNGSLGGGTAGYMPTWQSSSSCHSGSCLKFDGTDDYIDMGNGASLSPTANGITVEAWVYRTATLTGGYRWDIVAKSGWCGGSYSMGIDSPTNNVEDYVTVNGSCVGMDGSLFPMNQWVHEVMTAKAGGKLIAYINGIDVAETSLAAGTLNDNSNSLKINGYSFGQDVNPANLQGMIDNVTIYNYARTPAQIAWDYNRGKPVGWWKFDECQGTTAYDSSGNGNTGTISIGATGSQTTAGTCLTPTNGTGAWYNGKTGKFNSALSFDGADDYVRDAGSSTSLPYSSQAHSGFAWIYPTSNNTANNGVEIFDRNCNNTGVMWGLSISNGTLFFHGGADDFSSSLTVPLNQWSYVGYTYNGNTSTTVYLNNQSQTGTISQQLNVPLATNFSIGAACYFGYFAGKIDDVKIYNYALTPQQILLDYNQGSAVRFGPISGRP